MGEETVYDIWKYLHLKTQVAILQEEAGQQNVALQEDAACYIAQSFKSNLSFYRDVFGRLLTYSPLYGRRLTLDFTRRVFGNLTDAEDLKGTVDPVLKILLELRGTQRATSPRLHSSTIEPHVIFSLLKTRQTRKISRVRQQFEVNMREGERERLARLDVYERTLEVCIKKRKMC